MADVLGIGEIRCEPETAEGGGVMLSVVIPVYNEGAVLEKTASVIRGVLSDAAIGCELIFVDDGSKGRHMGENHGALRVRRHPRAAFFPEFRQKEAAILAGLASAKGDCCVVIDGDLQHPPEKIVEMYRLWEQGYEIVEGQKASRGAEEPRARSRGESVLFSHQPRDRHRHGERL